MAGPRGWCGAARPVHERDALFGMVFLQRRPTADQAADRAVRPLLVVGEAEGVDLDLELANGGPAATVRASA